MKSTFSIQQRLIGFGLHNTERVHVKYIGVFLEEASKEMLAKLARAKHGRVFGDHVTLMYEPNPSVIASFMPRLGEKVFMDTLREYCDERGQCVTVYMKEPRLGEITGGNGKCAHITVSCDEYTEANYSNKLIIDGDGSRLDSFILNGQIGFMMSDGSIDYGLGNDKITFKMHELSRFLDVLDHSAVVAPNDDSRDGEFELSVKFEGPLSPGAHDLRVMVQDAVGEFAAARTPSSSYVTKRYPEYDAKAMERKIEEVERRCAWARSFRLKAIKPVLGTLSEIMRSIQEAIEDNAFDYVRSMLEKVNIEHSDTRLLIAIMTATAPAKKDIGEAWVSFSVKVQSLIEGREGKRTADELLSGIV